jgi:thioredoxin reductase
MNVPCFAYPDGTTASLAAEVKKAVNVPVIAGGKIHPALGAELIGEGKADFVAFGRPHFADPELSNKLREGRLAELRWCLRCCNCLRLGPGMLSCTMNPFLFRESSWPPKRADVPKTVMVIGGGVAGMEAAVTAAQRGHYVSLYERSRNLGGQWRVAARLQGKEDYGKFTEYLERQLHHLGVLLNLGVEVTKEDVMRIGPEAVIVATGGAPLALKVPGADGPNVVQAVDVIAGEAEVGSSAVVVGGGLLGMETALMLVERGAAVSLISDIGLGGRKGIEEHFVFRTLFKKLVDLRVPLYLHAPVLEITERGVILEASRAGHEIVSIPAETVVLAAGTQPVNELAAELEGVVPEVYAVGDCKEPRSASAATYEAAQAALEL